MKKLIGAVLVTALFTGCPFDDDDDPVTADPTASPTATPTASASPTPAATASPSASPSAAPTSGPSSAPTPTPSSAPTPTPSSAPTPTPSSAPTPSPTPGAGGSAEACFNPTLLTAGTKVVQTYKSTTSNGTDDFTDDRDVVGSDTYNGLPVIRTDGTTVSTVTVPGQGSTTTTTETQTFSQLDTAAKIARAVGTISETSVAGSAITISTVVDPPREDRYDLDPGDSYSQEFTVEAETTTSTPFGPSTMTTTTDINLTRTYNGRETMSVPAGTFETCKFTDVSEETADGKTDTATTINWFDVDSGLLVRNESGDTVSELQGAEINGTAVR